ncbi:hypothetical protein HZW02_002882 [Salmonella enterica]|nr:hypothetical protein [Salmonella enterica]EDV1890240.1 hypothetical protein [Salmonella enterica subsp. enterica]EFQ6637501.1 hypothetical protein [Salmonella enterica]EFS2828906.1 hypothetical protein [Salmonella enterica]EFW5474717.1 hypothetical protein [Salmonella enterica]
MAVMAGALISYRWWTSGDQKMFSIKRNGASVEITEIPSSIPFSVFKNIADETGANECMIAYAKGKDGYEVVIRHDNVNMASAVAWLALEKEKHITGVEQNNAINSGQVYTSDHYKNEVKANYTITFGYPCE